MKNTKEKESNKNTPLTLSKKQVDSVMGLYLSGKINEAIEMIKALFKTIIKLVTYSI